ncbi:hypothetical protein [Paracoccus sp. (in: a-proteobacteria)]|uniref:hypothetical protein n=1 Tax=Paracoccus sp. TaxID=267 RepID=UPI0028B040A6|nr:hypothetical protein [Paracoccus sp. (in: a-proteobacteria)]
MRDFSELLCTAEPADAAYSLTSYLNDLLFVAEAVLIDADQDTAEKAATAVSGVLRIAMAISARLEGGCEALTKEAKRGYWRGRVMEVQHEPRT